MALSFQPKLEIELLAFHVCFWEMSPSSKARFSTRHNQLMGLEWDLTQFRTLGLPRNPLFLGSSIALKSPEITLCGNIIENRSIPLREEVSASTSLSHSVIQWKGRELWEESRILLPSTTVGTRSPNTNGSPFLQQLLSFFPAATRRFFLRPNLSPSIYTSLWDKTHTLGLRIFQTVRQAVGLWKSFIWERMRRTAVSETERWWDEGPWGPQSHPSPLLIYLLKLRES